MNQSLDLLEHEMFEFAKGLKNCDPSTASARVKAAEIQLRAHRRSVYGDKAEVAFAGGVILIPAKAPGPE